MMSPEKPRCHRYWLLRFLGRHPIGRPDPTGALGVADLMPDKTIINLPGCPPNPYTLFGVVLDTPLLALCRNSTMSAVPTSPMTGHPSALPASRAL